jgi:hypothetical protein
MKRPPTTVALLLSSGWILPALFSVREWMRYSREAFGAKVEAVQMEPFPHAEASMISLTVAAIWLALAISFWVLIALRRLWGNR